MRNSPDQISLLVSVDPTDAIDATAVALMVLGSAILGALPALSVWLWSLQP